MNIHLDVAFYYKLNLKIPNLVDFLFKLEYISIVDLFIYFFLLKINKNKLMIINKKKKQNLGKKNFILFF